MNTTSAVPITAEQRAAFDRDGYLIIRGALGPDEVAAARQALDRVYTSMAKAGSLAPDGSMHLLSAVANCPQVAGLIDHPATFPYVWSTLGWNIHVHHSHARSRNYSAHTRKAVFFGYTYRWTVIRDDIASMRTSDWFGRLTPVQQQLLGGAGHADGDHAWGHDPATSPLYGWLQERGLLDPANPPLRP